MLLFQILDKFTPITTTTTATTSIISITNTDERIRPGKMHRAHLRNYRRTDIGIWEFVTREPRAEGKEGGK